MKHPSLPITAVLFDLDGTLVDTAPDFHHSINQLREKRGLGQIPFQPIRDHVSEGAAALTEIGFSLSRESDEFAEILQQLLDHYLAHIGEHSRLFEQLDQVLEWLQGRNIPWGIVTNKPDRFASPLLQHLGLQKSCRTLICPDQVTQRKPHPESLQLACRQINRSPEQCVYIGDHQRDIEAGRRAGMTTIAAAYGYINDPLSVSAWGADFVADNGAEILRWLKQHCGP